MLKFLFLLILSLYGSIGSIVLHPFCGIVIYYFFAILRPQWYWKWDLPFDLSWSFYVALSAMFSVLIWRVCKWLTVNDRIQKTEIRHHYGHLSMVLFGFWIWVTYYTAGNQLVAYPYFEEYIKIFIMLGVLSFVVNRIDQLVWLYFLVTGVLVYIAAEMVQIYFLNGYLYLYKRGFGGLDNNGAALMLAIGVPLCMHAWDRIQSSVRWLFLLAVPIVLYSVMISYSRGAMLSLVVTSPLYFLRFKHRKQLLYMYGLLAVFTVVMAGSEIQERFLSIGNSSEDGSAQSRLNSWSIAWRMACEKPIFGFGIRNSNLYTLAYGADIEGRTIHCQYLQIAADSGFVGAILYILTILTAFICLGQTRCKIDQGSPIIHQIINGVYRFFFPKRQQDSTSPTSNHSDRYLMILNGLEGALAVFCFGAIFLSLENFELAFLLTVLCYQVKSVFDHYYQSH